MPALEGKVAVITGATSGIGASSAELFVAEGAQVVIAGRRKDKGEQLAARLGSRASFIRTDVCVERDVTAMLDHALDRFGRIDCLFNNAGSIPTGARITDIVLEDFDTAVSVHVRSVLAGMKHAAPIMIRQRSGSIINMASIVGIQAGIGSLAYSTVKAAVLHMTRCAAIELGEFRIRVNSISPGPVVTGIFGKGSGVEDSSADDQADAVRVALDQILPQVQSLPGAGTPDDVAHAALFLASDHSRFVSGHDLVVDGGSMAGRPGTVMRQHFASFANAFRRMKPRRL